MKSAGFEDDQKHDIQIHNCVKQWAAGGPGGQSSTKISTPIKKVRIRLFLSFRFSFLGPWVGCEMLEAKVLMPQGPPLYRWKSEKLNSNGTYSASRCPARIPRQYPRIRPSVLVPATTARQLHGENSEDKGDFFWTA